MLVLMLVLVWAWALAPALAPPNLLCLMVLMNTQLRSAFDQKMKCDYGTCC